MSTVKIIAPCSHTITAHLFQSPCSKTLSLIKKIAIVAFHILTIGIPLFFYKIVSCCFPRKTHTELHGKKLQEIAVESVKSVTPTQAVLNAWSKFNSSKDDTDLKDAFEQTAKVVLPSENKPKASPVPAYRKPSEIAPRRFSTLTPAQVNPITHAATKFAREELRKFKAASPEKQTLETGFKGITRAPDGDLSHIMRLPKAFENALNAKLKALGNEAWKNEEVIKAADELMKVTFYKACQVLKDLSGLVDQFSKLGSVKTQEKFLNKVRSYQFEAFEQFTYVYHSIRSGKYWTEVRLKDPRDGTSEAYECWKYPRGFDAKQFYQEGTKQNEWRMLYNYYGEEFAKNIQVSALDKWYGSRSEEDYTDESFRPTPHFLNASEVNAIKLLSINSAKGINLSVRTELDACALKLVKETAVKAHPRGVLRLHSYFVDKQATIGFRID
jgi:hypothetical protein